MWLADYLAKPLKMFRSDRQGNMAVVTAVLAPTFFCVVGLAVDYSSHFRFKSNLQSTVDSAALAAAREISMSGAQDEALHTVAKNYVYSNVENDSQILEVDVEFDHEAASVEVIARQRWSPLFMQYFDSTAMSIEVSAKAQWTGTGKICVVGLNGFMDKTLKLEQSASLVGIDCGVYSNSDHKNSMKVGKSSEIRAEFICSSGGIDGWEKATFEPTPVVDCPSVGDPIAERPPPRYLGCKAHDFQVKDRNLRLKPGVYCGGLEISGNSEVVFEPGVYVIKDGPLKIDDGSTISGVEVGFYLTGRDAKLEIKEKTSVRLEAGTDGEMAGILFFEDRDAPKNVVHKISSNDARVLLGTIYLPKGRLIIDAKGKVADQSAYTAIISNMMELKFGPTLVLNSDYDATSVPVPSTLIGGKAYLAH